MKVLVVVAISILLIICVNSGHVVGPGKAVNTGIWNGQQIQYVAGEICVKLKPEIDPALRRNEISALLASVKATLEEDFDPILHWGLISVSEETDIFKIIQQLNQHSLVAVAEPNGLGYEALIPQDIQFSKQWHLDNTGSNGGGTADADIDAPEAWDITTGSSSIKVAVIDSGVPMETGVPDHTDLSGSRFIVGYDWVNNDSVPHDDRGHGTHVTGILGATANNTEAPNSGVVGVTWNSPILIEKAIDSTGGITTNNFYNAVYHAVIFDPSRILNCSLSFWQDYQQVRDAINLAYLNNVLVVAAAGNRGLYSDHAISYPAKLSSEFNNVIAVSATNSNDIISDFSSWGNEITVSAPGGIFNDDNIIQDIYSTKPIYSVPLPDFDYWWLVGREWYYLDGTSMAAPTVSGIAALILARNSSLAPSQVRTRIQDTADDKGDPGWDPYYGSGRVNAYRAVSGPLAPPKQERKETYQVKLEPNFPNPANPETWIPYSLAGDSDVSIRIYDIKGQIVRVLNVGPRTAGNYNTKEKAAYWDGRNERGERVSSGVYFYQIKAGAFIATRKMLILK